MIPCLCAACERAKEAAIGVVVFGSCASSCCHIAGLSAFFDWMVDGDAKKDPTLGTPQLFPGGLGMPDKVRRAMIFAQQRDIPLSLRQRVSII